MALQELNAEELVLVNGGGRTSINPLGVSCRVYIWRNTRWNTRWNRSL